MQHVELTVEGHVARVHLNRPEALNAITPAMDDALARAWQRINSDDGIRVALLTGAGDRAFCAGADIASGISSDSPHAFGGGLTGIGGPLVTLRKPLLAAVRGYAVGGGFELAMCADILFIDDTARFSLPEVPRGLIDHSGVLHRASRRLPLAVAMDMVLTGRAMHAEEAFRLGLASRLLAPGELLAGALEACDAIANSPPLAVQAAKAAFHSGLACPLEQALAQDYPAIRAFRASRDAAEAMAALRESRAPAWTGE